MPQSFRNINGRNALLVILAPFLLAACSPNNFQPLSSLSVATCGNGAQCVGTGLSTDVSFTPTNSTPLNGATFDARTEYNSLPASTEGSLSFSDRFGHMALGSSVLERNQYSRSERSEICRKSGAVVPHPEYRYRCFLPTTTGDAARATFEALSLVPFFVKGSTYGAGVYTDISERTDSNETTLCQIYSKDAFTSFYACFQAR